MKKLEMAWKLLELDSSRRKTLDEVMAGMKKHEPDSKYMIRYLFRLPLRLLDLLSVFILKENEEEAADGL